MSSLDGKSVIIGVTGGIAAYKAAEIVRGLRSLGADVTVVMTENARRFVGPVTFEALSGKPVIDNLWASPRDASMEHLALAKEADLVLVAPATANTIAKMAAGLADDLLSTLLLAVEGPVLVAPAMNTRMIGHAATRANLGTIAARGVHVVDAESGPLAENESGYGRLADPATIVKRAAALLGRHGDLAGRRILVTAGPTREAIDPVRYVSNRSSGKMGCAVAAEARERGAEVTLVHGPMTTPVPAGVNAVAVVSAAEMLAAVRTRFESAHVLVMAAAVADFRPVAAAGEKLKKSGRTALGIDMEPTEDILAEAGRSKGSRIVVGFAAETGNLEEAARKKLAEKGLDMIAANDVTLPGAGFDGDTNVMELFTAAGGHIPLPLMSKREAAARILDEIAKLVGPVDS